MSPLAVAVAKERANVRAIVRTLAKLLRAQERSAKRLRSLGAVYSVSTHGLVRAVDRFADDSAEALKLTKKKPAAKKPAAKKPAAKKPAAKKPAAKKPAPVVLGGVLTAPTPTVVLARWQKTPDGVAALRRDVLARIPRGERVRIADLKSKLALEAWPADAVDRALIALQNDGELVLFSADNKRELKQADYDAVLTHANRFHYFVRR